VGSFEITLKALSYFEDDGMSARREFEAGNPNRQPLLQLQANRTVCYFTKNEGTSTLSCCSAFRIAVSRPIAERETLLAPQNAHSHACELTTAGRRISFYPIRCR
jgi:hypothetical protein